MLYVAIGLITLFASFLIALIILIRELSQRADIDETLNDYSLDLAEAVVPTGSNRADFSDLTQEEASIEPLSQEAVPASDLAEVVPFPWVMEEGTQFPRQEELGKPQEEVVSNESNQGQNPVNLNSSFSVSDLVNKD